MSTGDAQDGMLKLSIADNGSGFPEQLLARAFEPYMTTKPKGTGLGLPIVKKDRGRTRRKNIHREPGTGRDMREHPVALVVGRERGGVMTAKNILVVDDEAGIRELLSEILFDEGYGVHLAENAVQARQLLRNNVPTSCCWISGCRIRMD